MSVATIDIADVRRRFSSLAGDFAFFDAAGGTQVPDEVGVAIAEALRTASGNLGAPYATGDRVAEILSGAEQRSARFLGCAPHEIVLGANMSTLNFTLTRTASREFEAGDEILVSRLDHDANAAPWIEVAHDRGVVVKLIDVHDDTTLDFDDLEAQLSERTRVVAFSWAANSVGTVIDAQRACELAHRAGALAWIDAVHYAAHEPIDVAAIGADILLCSPYKFCGPHLGIAYVREEVAREWRPYKVRPAATEPLGRRFETGTQPYELLAGLNATFDYLDEIGGMAAIRDYERALAARLLDELPDRVTIYGRQDLEQRVPTFLLNVEGMAAADLTARLVSDGFGVWCHDTYYALGLYERLGYDQAVRLGIIHYNSEDEVDRLAAAISAAASGS